MGTEAILGTAVCTGGNGWKPKYPGKHQLDIESAVHHSALQLLIGEKPRKKVLETVRAMEMHMVLSCIAIGILQSLSICFIGKINSSQIRYQKTPSRGRVSEATLMHYFRKHFFRLLGQKLELSITQIIQEMQNEPAKPWDSMLS